MANITINTTAPAYTTRRAQFADIVNFYGPRLKLYLQMDEQQKQTWRQSDPFLRDILDFARKISRQKHGEF